MNLVRVFLALLGAGALLFTTGCGITASAHSAGYADFDASYYQGLKRDTSISLGPSVLRFAARHAKEDPETKALLRAIDGVRVSVYELTGDVNHDTLIQSLSGTASELAADEWQTIVRIREESKTVFVLLKEGENAISGITLLTADAQELVFVNVMGELSPEVLARVADEVPGGHALAYASAPME